MGIDVVAEQGGHKPTDPLEGPAIVPEGRPTRAGVAVHDHIGRQPHQDVGQEPGPHGRVDGELGRAEAHDMDVVAPLEPGHGLLRRVVRAENEYGFFGKGAGKFVCEFGSVALRPSAHVTSQEDDDVRTHGADALYQIDHTAHEGIMHTWNLDDFRAAYILMGCDDFGLDGECLRELRVLCLGGNRETCTPLALSVS